MKGVTSCVADLLDLRARLQELGQSENRPKGEEPEHEVEGVQDEPDDKKCRLRHGLTGGLFPQGSVTRVDMGRVLTAPVVQSTAPQLWFEG